MDKNNTGHGTTSLIVWSLIALVLGGILTYVFFPNVIEKQVPYETVKVVEKPVEVLKEVPVDYTQELVNDFLNKIEEDEDYDKFLVCDDERYDFEQLSISRIYDKHSVSFDTTDTDDLDDASRYITTVKLRLKYADADVEDKCYETVTVTGKYTEGEATKISYK